MHIHILGICGTFMGGLAALAKALGHRVTGSDMSVYPPMSTQLEAQGITIYQGYDAAQFEPKPDLVIVGNAMSRGNPAVEYLLEQRIPYQSGPEWMRDNLLQQRWVLAVAGTHGKTTTASMLTWMLEYAGMQPGFLVGGVLQNFGVTARLGESDFFVIEADEYDSAFFDKRSKFVHYLPDTLILNNLEFDHADIFSDLAAIERQFQHLLRTVPRSGLVLYPTQDTALQRVISGGCWTPLQTMGESGDWHYRLLQTDGSQFEVSLNGETVAEVGWQLIGEHNVKNAVMAIAAARHIGILPEVAAESLTHFINTKRRMELHGEVDGIRVYDDFAHHPTAIAATLAGLRAKVGSARIMAILEPRSNTMKQGVHQDTLAESLRLADDCFLLQPEGIDWSLQKMSDEAGLAAQVAPSVDELVARIVAAARPGDHLLVMSNGGFGDIHNRLLDALGKAAE